MKSERGEGLRILLVRLSAMGDVILSSPIVAAIKDQLPDAEIDWAVETPFADIARMCKGVSNVISIPRLRDSSGIFDKKFRQGWGEACRKMRQRNYDYSLDPHGALRSAIAVSAAGAEIRVGWAPRYAHEGNWISSNYWVNPLPFAHAVDSWLQIATPLVSIPEHPRFPLEIPDDAISNIQSFISSVSDGRRVVTITMGTSKARKNWSLGRYVETVIGLKPSNVRCILTWGNESERNLAQQLVDQSDSTAVLAPKMTLMELAALVKLSDLFIGGDTGATHLAVAFGTTVIGIYGPANPGLCGPYGDEHHIFSVYSGLANRVWDRKAPEELIESIESDTVIKQALAVLNNGSL